MRRLQTLVAAFFILFLSTAWADISDRPVRVKGEVRSEPLTAFSLFFPPDKNNVILEPQRIDYDLTKKNVIRMGPYFLSDNTVRLQITREQSEFYEVEFGMEVRRKMGSIYVLSFQWPRDYINEGVIEIINEKGESYWRRQITEKNLSDWQDLLARKEISSEDLLRMRQADPKASVSVARPQKLSPVHLGSSFGLAHKGFYEVPIAQIREPFRFCVSKEDGQGRVALCSQRYQFYRTFGEYGVKSVQKPTRPRVLVNDKEVTLKGTAIFLDYETPIKFSALLQNGTYYEFISKPKEIRVVDMVYDVKNEQIQVVGYGDQPMGQVDESFYADSVHWGFLNFMPTIGDLRKFWRATVSPKAPYLYLKGDGGAPFRQNFTFEALPTTAARLELKPTTQRTTYNSVAKLQGKAGPGLVLSADDTAVRRLGESDFEWSFLAPNPGEMNRGFLNVEEGGRVWKGQYDIYRGYSAELSARLTAIASVELDFLILGEVAGQYWFEKVLGWDNYTFSKLRWGLAAKHFSELFVAGEDPNTQGIVTLSVSNVDLKYRFTPGIWGRDPTVGAILAYQNIEYGFRQSGNLITSTNAMVGGGMFWARSMPRVFDDLFNILPIFRYPKWVDMEVIYYPLALEADKTAAVNVAFNFHGKVQWTPRFFGEGGFGLKTFNYDDPTAGPLGKKIGLGIAYGTVGLGFNF